MKIVKSMNKTIFSQYIGNRYLRRIVHIPSQHLKIKIWNYFIYLFTSTYSFFMLSCEVKSKVFYMQLLLSEWLNDQSSEIHNVASQHSFTQHLRNVFVCMYFVLTDLSKVMIFCMGFVHFYHLEKNVNALAYLPSFLFKQLMKICLLSNVIPLGL